MGKKKTEKAETKSNLKTNKVNENIKNQKSNKKNENVKVSIANKHNNIKVSKKKPIVPVKPVATKKRANKKENSNLRGKKKDTLSKINVDNNLNTSINNTEVIVSANISSKKSAVKNKNKKSVEVKSNTNTSNIQEPKPVIENNPNTTVTTVTNTENTKEVIDISKYVKNVMPTGKANEVILKCVQQGSKLRVRIVTKGFYNDANCQFPKSIRKAGRMYKVHISNVVLASGSSGRYFYRVNSGIEVLNDKEVTVTSVTVFEDKSDSDCAVCLCVPKTTVIVPCGHFYTCMPCAQKLDKCPICRGDIQKLIDKTSMD
jgi:hypothetical protein